MQQIGVTIMSDQNLTRSRKGASGVLFIGFILLGLAAGFFLENIAAGLFAGLGIGFIAMGIMRAITGEW
jgi:hypothetical protein